MRYNSLFIFGLAALSFSLGSCEGPTGKDGAPGESIIGPKGDKGDKGEPGSVIYSQWQTLGTSGWQETTMGGVGRYKYEINVPALSQSLVDNGSVAVYVKLNQENGEARPLPYSLFSSISNGVVVLETRYDYTFSASKITLWGFDPVNGALYRPQDLQFRYILIPGGQSGRVANTTLTYDDAVRAYGIQD